MENPYGPRPQLNQLDGGPDVGSAPRSAAFSGRILSRSNEPSPGWRGLLVEVLDNALVFETDPTCTPMLPTLLPAFSLISPSFPDSPGAARVAWGPRGKRSGSTGEGNSPGSRWLPHALRQRLRPGALLAQDSEDGRSLWRIEGLTTLEEEPAVERPRLVLAPPRRRDPKLVQKATLNSLFRAVRSVPPENDLKHLVEVSRKYFAEAPGPNFLESTLPLSDLVGYGAGRTSCGDDYLVGFVCGLDLSASLDPRVDATLFHEYRVRFVAAVHRLVGRTTLLGRQVLLAAFHGLYSTPLLDEADALSDCIIIGPGEPEWSLLRRPTASPGWAALLGMLTGAYIVGAAPGLRRRPAP